MSLFFWLKRKILKSHWCNKGLRISLSTNQCTPTVNLYSLLMAWLQQLMIWNVTIIFQDWLWNNRCCWWWAFWGISLNLTNEQLWHTWHRHEGDKSSNNMSQTNERKRTAVNSSGVTRAYRSPFYVPIFILSATKCFHAWIHEILQERFEKNQ